ncbi:Riboflavin transporter RfnT [bacterium HR12]|nr:Riboflavin transporter RfnT [bacterium HR12]
MTATILEARRRALVRRNTILLVLAQGLVQVAFPVLLVVGSVEIARLAGRDAATGFLNAVYFLAAAGGAAVVGRLMDRVGRRPGLLASYALLALAGALGAASVLAGVWWGLLVCAVPFGIGLGGANLARGAVADMYPPERRGRAVGLVMAAGTAGAVGSPFLVAALRAVDLGVGPDVLPWSLVLLGSLGAFACVLAVRPDPRDLAVRSENEDDPARPRLAVLGLPPVRAAIVVAAVGQMAMIGVMGVTPVALHHREVGPTAVSTVIGVHIAGMFALSPLVGLLLDRTSHRAGLFAGGLLTLAGSLLAATEAGALVVGAGLFAIGLGWCATFLGATAVISDATGPSERAGALGLNDLVVSLSSAAAGLGGALVFEGAGYRALGLATAALVAVGLVSAARVRPAPAIRGG